MAALTIRSFLKLCTYLNPSSQFFSQCIPSSPGLGLASADLAARNENRRGKLWKGLVICLHTFYLQKGKAKAPEHGGQQCAGGKALRLTPAQQELNSPIWGRLTQHLSRWGCRGSKPCLLPFLLLKWWTGQGFPWEEDTRLSRQLFSFQETACL